VYTYPTLDETGTLHLPEMEDWDEGASFDPTYRSPKQSGLEKTYPMVSWVSDQWAFRYRYLPNADKELLWDFERAVLFGSETWAWVHFETSDIYGVRFAKEIEFKRETDRGGTWNVFVVIKQAVPEITDADAYGAGAYGSDVYGS